MKNKKILVTGCAGFIGMNLCKRLLESDANVLGIDNLNNYYSVKLKKDRLKLLENFKSFSFEKINISVSKKLNRIVKSFKPEIIINLAAQAGVRYSIENPKSYISSNINGFFNILECCRHNNISKLIYASSSSVYGGNEKTPFSIGDNVSKPLSLYAATKRSNELMAYSYGHLYKINTIGLRFFTVYGPWGRPDMAMYKFTKKIINGKSIDVYNQGKMERDFTFITDIINGIESCIMNKQIKNTIFNLGNNSSVNIMDMIKILENSLQEKAKINYKTMQLGDVEKTFADIKSSKEMIGYSPVVSIEKGIPLFVDWYKEYQKNKY